ncbi:hypothetical protein GCM10025788_10770 [Serinicoccus chungangensis]
MSDTGQSASPLTIRGPFEAAVEQEANAHDHLDGSHESDAKSPSGLLHERVTPVPASRVGDEFPARGKSGCRLSSWPGLGLRAA